MFPEILVKVVFPYGTQPNFSFVLIVSPRQFCFFYPKNLLPLSVYTWFLLALVANLTIYTFN